MLTVDPQKMLEEEGLECLTPDLPDEIIGDINSSPALQAYKHELVRGARAEAELALHRQNRIKEASDRIERCYMDGIGRRVASIDKVLFDRLCRVWGPKWFRDPERLHRVLEENPVLAVKCEGWRNPSFRMPGFRDQRDAGPTKQKQCQTQERDEVKGGSAGGNGILQGSAVARCGPEVPAATPAFLSSDEIPDAQKPWAIDVIEVLRPHSPALAPVGSLNSAERLQTEAMA